MSNLWPRIEPLLARVEKPARYIGMERGSVRPAHRPGLRSPGCSSTPTPTRSGCPTRGSRSSTRSSTNATTPSPSAPTRRGSTSKPRCGPRRCRSSRSTPTATAADFDVLAFNLSAELVSTNLLNCLDLAGVPVRAEDRGAEHPIVIAGGHCTFNPEPLADFVDAFVIGDGEEPVGEITEVIGRVETQRSVRSRGRAARAGDDPRCLRAVDVRRHLRRRVHRRGAAALRRRARRASTSARSPTWRTGRTRSSSSCR